MMLPPAPPPIWVKKWLGAPTGRGVRVGIIGTGFDRTIADPRVLPGVGMVDPRDDLALLQTDDDAWFGAAAGHRSFGLQPVVQSAVAVWPASG